MYTPSIGRTSRKSGFTFFKGFDFLFKFLNKFKKHRLESTRTPDAFRHLLEG